MKPHTRSFPVTRVSTRARDLVQSLEAAFTQMHAAELAEEVAAAYSIVQLCRQSLFTYLADLERTQRIERPVTLRF